MLFQCSSHAHHSAQRLSITSQHTPTHHLHCSSLHSALGATQLQTSVQHHTAHRALLLISSHVMLCNVMSSHSWYVMPYQEPWHYVTSHCHHIMTRDTMTEHIVALCRVVSCRNGMLCHTISCCAMLCNLVPCIVFYVVSHLVMSRNIMLCYIILCHLLFCHITSHHVTSHHVMLC